MESFSPDETTQRDASEGDEPGRGDWLKRLAYLGVGTLFLTQEAALRLVRELKLPREAGQLLLREMEKNKGELLSILREVLSEFLNNLELKELLKERVRELKPEELLRHLLKGLHLKVQGEIRLGYSEASEKEPPSSL